MLSSPGMESPSSSICPRRRNSGKRSAPSQASRNGSTDPRFKTKESRGKHYEALNEGLAVTFKADTRETWLDKLGAADVPCAPLNTLAEAFDDPQVKHLKMREDVEHVRVGKVGLVRNGLRMSATPPAIYSAAPDLGEHTEEVLAALRTNA